MMRDQRNQGKNNEYKFWTKGVALLAAVTLLVTTLGSGITTGAGSYHSGQFEISGGNVPSGGAIAEIITASAGYEKLTSVKAYLGNPNDAYNYTAQAYVFENVSGTEDLSVPASVPSGKCVKFLGTKTASGAAGTKTAVNFDIDSDIIIESGETLAVLVVLTTTDANGVVCYYKDSSTVGRGYSRRNGSWSSDSCVIALETDTVTTPPNPGTITIKVGDATSGAVAIPAGSSISLSSTYSESSKQRTILYDISPSGIIETSSAKDKIIASDRVGSATITAYYGSVDTYHSESIKVYVYKPQFLNTEKFDVSHEEDTDRRIIRGEATYTGNDIIPAVGFDIGESDPVTGSILSIVNSGTTDSDKKAKSVGTVTIGFSGTTTDGATMQGSLPYTISAKSIADGSANIIKPAAANIAVDQTTDTVTAISGFTYGTKEIALGTDVDAVATRTGFTETPIRVKYSVTVTGKGNYKDSFTVTDVPGAVGAGEAVDLNDILTVNIPTAGNNLKYTGKEIKLDNIQFYTKGANPTEITLSENVDYQIEYENNIDASVNTQAKKATAIIKGIGNYGGEIRKDFIIERADIGQAITNEEVTLIFAKDDYGHAEVNAHDDPDSIGTYFINGPRKTSSGVEPEIKTFTRKDSSNAPVTLTEDTDYEISYLKNNKTTNGGAKLIITGKGNYDGDVTYSFSIENDFKTDLRIQMKPGGGETVNTGSLTSPLYVSDFAVDYSETNGVADDKHPVPQAVILGDRTLQSGTDYEIEYPTGDSNKNAGEYDSTNAENSPRIIIKGKGQKYAGKQVVVYFKINRMQIKDDNSKLFIVTSDVGLPDHINSDSDITNKFTAEYNGAEHPALGETYYSVLYVNGYRKLSTSVDLDTTSFTNNVNAGTASVRAQGLGNYYGDVTGHFEITPCDISKASIVLTEPTKTYPYTGSEIKPEFTVTLNGETVPSTNYTVTGYDKNIKPSSFYGQNATETASFTVEGKGNLTGTKEQKFTITAHVISTISGEYSFTVGGSPVVGDESGFTAGYDGLDKCPAVTVRKGSTLIPENCYDLSYTNNTNVSNDGWATVTVTGRLDKGYGGAAVLKFKIEPLKLGDPNSTQILGVSDGTAGNRRPDGASDKIKLYQHHGYRYNGDEDSVLRRDGNGNIVPNVVMVYNGSTELRRADGDNPVDTSADFYIVAERSVSPSNTPVDSSDLKVASANTKIARVVGINNYSGSFLISYTVGKDISTLGDDKIYLLDTYNTGTPAVKSGDIYQVNYKGVNPAVGFNATSLVASGSSISVDTHYTTSYSPENDYNASSLTHTVTVIGKPEGGIFYGSKVLKFKINPVPLTGDDILVTESDINRAYTGNTHKTTIVAKEKKTSGDNSWKNLTAGTDFTVSINSGAEESQGTFGPDQGIYTATVTFKGNYSGDGGTKTYNISTKSITDPSVTVTLSSDSITYTGSNIGPGITVKDGTTTLKNGVDYVYYYENPSNTDGYTNPGNYNVTIEGTGNYEGTRTQPFSIAKMNLSSCEIEFVEKDTLYYDGTVKLYYDGTQKQPPIRVFYGTGDDRTELEENTDYTITYDASVLPGRRTGTINAVSTGLFDGAQDFHYSIVGQINDTRYFTIENAASSDYRLTKEGGWAISPAPAVILKHKAINGNAESIIDPSKYNLNDNYLKTRPGARRLYAEAKTGSGYYYEGSAYRDVTVNGMLKDGEIVSEDYVTYKGETYSLNNYFRNLGPEVKYHGETLEEDIYTWSIITQEADAAASTGSAIDASARYFKIKATAKPAATEYKGVNAGEDTLEKKIKILYDLSKATIEWTNGSSFTYNGASQGIEGKIRVKCYNTVIDSDCYDLEYDNDTDAGSWEVIVKAKEGRSIGQKTTSFTIARTPMDSSYTLRMALPGQAEVDISAENADNPAGPIEYMGVPIVPESVSVSKNGVELTEGRDFVYTVRSNTDAGTATVFIEAKGNYSGQATRYFTITPKNIGGGNTPASGISIINGTDEIEYNGNPTLPALGVMYTNVQGDEIGLTKDTDYEMVLSNNATSTVIGDNYVDVIALSGGNYTGSFRQKFTVNKRNISGFTATYGNFALEREYNGQPTSITDIRSNLTVTDTNGNPLSKGTDYDIRFDSGATEVTAVGEYRFTIYCPDASNYTGTITGTYSITKRSINSNNIRITYTDKYDYTGQPVTITDLVVTDTGRTGNQTLILGTDYTVEYTDNVTSGQKTATLIGQNDYAGSSREITFYIGDNIADFSLDYTKSFSYTGHEQKPLRVNVQTTHDSTVSLTRDNPSKTVNGATFALTYETSGSTDAGTYNISVTATGGRYYGTKTAQYTINPVSVSASNLDVQFAPSELERKDANGHYNYPFTGSEICPPVVVKYIPNGGTPMNLTEGEDYDVIYKNNINVGGPIPITVQLAPNRNFSNSPKKSISFYITGIDTEAAGRIELYNGDDYDYTGSAIKPYISKIYDSDGNELYDGEYKILSTTYENNVNPGEATMKVTLGGNYSGTITKTFRIIAPVTSANIDAISDQFYTGAKQEPKLRVHIGTIVLEQGEGKDYTVEYTSPDNWENNGLATVTLNPEGQYYDYIREDETPLQKTFKIVKDASALKPTIADSFTYTGYPIKPLEEKADAISMPDGTKITYDKNGGDHTYTITGYQRYDESTKKYAATTDHTNAGKIRATIKMKIGDTTVDKEVDYEILRRAITSTNISTLRNEVYTASAKTPNVYINYTYKDPNDNALTKTYTLVKDKDYSVAYKDNTNPGTAQVIITGLGNFTGTDTEQFKITVPDVTGLKSSGSQTSVTLSWNKNNRITGYKIYSSDGKTYYGQTEGTSFTKNNLQAGRDYSFGVIPYVTAGGKTTNGNMATLASSTVVSVPVVTPGTNAQGVNGAALSFGTVNGVNYKIFRANSANGTYKQIATVPGSMAGYTDRNVTSGRVYYYKIQAVKILADGTVIKSEMSTPVAVTAK